MKRKEVTALLHIATDMIIGSVTNMILYQIFLTMSVAGATSSARLHQAFVETDELLESINYKTIKTALYNMTKRGIIQKSKHASGGGFEVTEQGLIRLQSFVPQYLTKRQWDNHLYLISYDIPSTASNKRDQFRRFLRNTGCGLLQESLWITPYNLQKFIDQFVKERSIPGTILVSKLGRDGAIGKESLETLLEQVYKLSDLNDRYALFLERFKYVNQPTASQRVQIALMYHKILKKDPQLPFELLPPGFLAAKAYQFYSSNIHQN